MYRNIEHNERKELPMKQDLTKGNIFSLIISFAIPLFVSNLFQQIYNLADTTIVGHILGDQALAAVGSVCLPDTDRLPAYETVYETPEDIGFSV